MLSPGAAGQLSGLRFWGAPWVLPAGWGEPPPREQVQGQGGSGGGRSALPALPRSSAVLGKTSIAQPAACEDSAAEKTLNSL